MEKSGQLPPGGKGESHGYPRWRWSIAVACLIVLSFAILLPRQPNNAVDRRGAISNSAFGNPAGTQRLGLSNSWKTSEGDATAEEIVAGKVSQFARDRRRITHAMAKRFKLDVPTEVDQFFEAVGAGRWTELNSLFDTIKQLRDSGQNEGLRTLFAPILEAQLVAECTHAWPAQKLLDYGQSILGTLQPGMVYVGGTDPGRGIPTLLNETSDGEHHIVLTQNGLADNTYMQYVNFLYGDQMTQLTEEDSKRAFDDYLADAQKRLLHDQQFPDEPKQVRPGEDIRFMDGSDQNGSSGDSKRVQVSGQVAVMAINERLLQAIMDKNPALSFGLEESFPLQSTYSTAVPVGPIMELRVQDAQNAFTPERAAESVDYWQTMAQQIISDPEVPEGSDPRKTYSHMADAQANLLAAHNYNSEAEQEYRLAMQLEPSNPEAVDALSDLLTRTGRADEARQLAENFQRNYPNQHSVPVPFVVVGSPGSSQH